MIKRISITLLAILFFAGGNIMADNLLTTKEKNIVSVSQYTATGDLQNLKKSSGQKFR